MKRSDITTKMVIESCDQFHRTKSGISPIDFLINQTNCPHKVAYSALVRELDRGYINYGTAIEYSFVTSKGYDVLEMLEL